MAEIPGTVFTCIVGAGLLGSACAGIMSAVKHEAEKEREFLEWREEYKAKHGKYPPCSYR